MPGQLNISCAQFPVTVHIDSSHSTIYAVHSIVPPRRKNSEHTCDTFRAKCPMIVAFSQPHRKLFQDLFRTLMTLQPLSTILLYIRGSLEYNNSFRKNSSMEVTLSVPYVHVPCESRLHCKNFRVKIFSQAVDPMKIFQHQNFSNENFI